MEINFELVPGLNKNSDSAEKQTYKKRKNQIARCLLAMEGLKALVICNPEDYQEVIVRKIGQFTPEIIQKSVIQSNMVSLMSTILTCIGRLLRKFTQLQSPLHLLMKDPGKNIPGSF